MKSQTKKFHRCHRSVFGATGTVETHDLISPHYFNDPDWRQKPQQFYRLRVQ
jgi:hypothetical protein